jgi:2-oxo-3-hexenedioate decarboxylase
MTMPAAYRQATEARRELIARYLQDGMRIVGIKIALTSPDAQTRLGTDRPIWGWLTDTMEIPDGAVIDAAQGSRLRAEAELVFELGDDIAGPGITRRDVLDATAAIRPGIELPARAERAAASAGDLIMRNAMAAHFLVGDALADWHRLDLSLLGVVMEVNGEPASSGCPATVLGHPADAIAAVANDLARQESGTLSAGQLVFTGGITPAVALLPAMTVNANFCHLGRVSLSVAAHPPSEVDT